jgi:allophanate hydrolase subunit 2
VIDADLPLIGQIRPGDRIWFRRINAQTARQTSLQRQRLIASFISGFNFR